MGLFWAESTIKDQTSTNKTSTSNSSWFWSSSVTGNGTQKQSSCPHKPVDTAGGKSEQVLGSANSQAVSACPVMHKNSSSTQPAADISACPVMHKTTHVGDTVDSNHINPLNNMPSHLPDQKQAWQKLDLPTERTLSSIPKGDGSPWEYPSPQQMYNAMIRKGKIDPNTGEEIPEDAVESMVFVHNFLNEGCWQEVLDWEEKYASKEVPTKLLRFMGRPDDLSPRARLFHYLSYVFPSKFNRTLPFDRHDWYVLRPDPSSQLNGNHPGYKEVRYVIDFYEGPDDEEGMPTFNLDVRPALDNFENGKDRAIRWAKPIMEQIFDTDKKNKD
ncbi:hypothetical protein ACO0QE_003880 [Hanseniaspora vineae]